MKDFIKDIIIEKKFFELTRREKIVIKKYAKNEEEYDALKLTFLAVNSLKKENEAELSPSVKNRLSERFAAKHSQQNESFGNKILLFFFPRNTQFFKKPAFQLVMVAIVVALIVPFLWQNDAPQYAMKDDSIKLKVDSLEALNKKQNSSLKEEVKEEVEVQESENQLKESVIDDSPEIIAPTLDILQPKINMDYKNIQADEIYLEEVVETQSAKRMNADAQQMDDMSMTAGRDMAEKSYNDIPKKVEVSETLGLLTALY